MRRFTGGGVTLLTGAFYRHRSHEWQKHGTCAAQLGALGSQRKYFRKGLDLYEELALSRWETQAACSPASLAPCSRGAAHPQPRPGAEPGRELSSTASLTWVPRSREPGG